MKKGLNICHVNHEVVTDHVIRKKKGLLKRKKKFKKYELSPSHSQTTKTMTVAVFQGDGVTSPTIVEEDPFTRVLSITIEMLGSTPLKPITSASFLTITTLMSPGTHQYSPGRHWDRKALAPKANH